jgi:hypothetical protein
MPDLTVDWFVAAAARFGNGSRDKPFHDPWLAIRAAGPGDVIHIAAGTYFGRYDRSSWIVECPDLTIRGGYSLDFSKREPWRTPSVFAAFQGYESTRENNLIGGRGDHSGLVLDGLFFDASGRNTYGDKPAEGIRSYPQMDGPIASFNAGQVTIRNCVFANSAAGGVELAGDGSHFENNLLINIIGPGMLELRSASGGNTQPIAVVNNTFCFAHDDIGPVLGTGAHCAIGVRVQCRAVLQDNVFVSCGNAAIALFLDPDRVHVDRNLFYLTPHDIVKGRVQGSRVDMTEKNIDELEDVGFKSASGNVVQDPGLTGFKLEWLDAYSRHLLANYATPPREAANALRTAAGLPALTPADLERPESKGDFAPRLRPLDALALCFTAKQGFHVVELATEIKATPPAAPLTYKPVEWSVIDNPDASLANARVELRAGLGSEQNVTLLEDAGSTTHIGIRIYRPSSDDQSIYVLARRNTLAARQYEDATKYSNGREVESSYTLRGIYRTDIQPLTRQRVTLIVESIIAAPLAPAPPAPRPEGRDWFVKAGSSGGDGTREKPFRDPFQALDKAAGGDAIHVAGGDYFGKLRSGKWRIQIRNLMLLGGYDGDFAERDPWKNPTRFLLNEEEKAKGTREGTILASEQDSDGLILDGFIFDGATYNTYTPSGSLDLDNSPLAPLVSLRGGRAPIEIRNCLFINASSAAISISCPFGIFENNIVLNSSNWSLSLNANGPGPWIIRNNTILFACDPSDRAGTGKSSPDGTLLMLIGRAVTAVESNIFAFADNYGVRSAITQQNVSFNNNVFAANLFNHLTDEKYLWADNSTWERRAVADSPFASFQGNTLDLPQLPVDSGFADAALSRLFTLPSRISADQWKTIAAQIGSSAVPVLSAPTAAVPTIPPTAATPSAAPTPASPAATPAPAHSTSVSDLLARLANLKDKMKEEESVKTTEIPEHVYCPVFDWKRALALAQETSGAEAGVHRVTLTVSFTAVYQTAAEIQYMPLTPQEIDVDHASLDNKLVKLEINVTGDSSTDPSYFPTGTTRSDFDAFSVVTVGAATHTHIAIIVRHDTATSKVLYRMSASDTLRICGTARVPRDRRALSIVVDNAEPVEL